MLSEYMQKIDQYLKTDVQNYQYQLNSINHNHNYSQNHNQDNNSLNIDYEIKRSSQYIDILKKNSYKIQQLISDNDKLKHQNYLQTKTIEIHLKKQIELKYLISNLQQDIHNLNQKLIYFQSNHISNNIQNQPNLILPKQFYKLQQKLSNCITENQILRQQNNAFRDQQFTKQKNYRIIQQKFKQNLKSMSQDIHLLKTDLQYQTQKACLLQKIQTQNNLLKMENKRLQSTMDIKLDEYDRKIAGLLNQLQNQRYGKQTLKQKYQQLTDIIKIVDQMRYEFKTKKKSLQYNNQEKELLNNIEFNSSYPLVSKTNKIISKQIKTKTQKQNLFKQ